MLFSSIPAVEHMALSSAYRTIMVVVVTEEHNNIFTYNNVRLPRPAVQGNILGFEKGGGVPWFEIGDFNRYRFGIKYPLFHGVT